MDVYNLSYTDYQTEASEFVLLSKNLGDSWQLYNYGIAQYNTCIRKECFKEVLYNNEQVMLKAEYLISYNVSYGVPMCSFNYWKSSGVLLSLEEIRKLSLIRIDKEDFYMTITQQEHPVLFRPFYTVHPCHTGTLLSNFNLSSKNIIVTFLSLVAPLLQLNISNKYAM